MFYSHQLLARKAPLGQIWMAATLHAKINRKRLNKLDIIKICEEILNPSVPMTLRLSGILRGGVVIVYQRKVKLLNDDVSRLPVEISEAWRIRPAVDPTVLPKGKTQAKYEAVTLPENMMDMELFSDVDTPKFWGMRLEDLDDQYVNVNLDDDDFSCADHHNQAEAVNITLVDNFESGLAETDAFNRFERFDIADDGTTVNITPDEHPQVPSTLVPSPPRQEDPPQQQEQHCGAPSPTQAEPQQAKRLSSLIHASSSGGSGRGFMPSKWILMMIAVLVISGSVQVSATCDATKSAFNLVSDCSDYLDNPTQDCCASLFVTLAEDRCVCQVTSEPFFLMSHLADSGQLAELMGNCRVSPLLYTSVDNCKTGPETPPPAQACPPPASPPCVSAAPASPRRCSTGVAIAGWAVAALLLLALGLLGFWSTSSVARGRILDVERTMSEMTPRVVQDSSPARSEEDDSCALRQDNTPACSEDESSTCALRREGSVEDVVMEKRVSKPNSLYPRSTWSRS